MCWRLPFVLWMLLGFTPFVFMWMDVYFDGFSVWASASLPRWTLRVLVIFFAIVWIVAMGTLWLTPCPR